MTRQSFANCLKWGSVALLLAGVLFAGGAVSQSGGLVGSVFREVSAVCRDDSTQWMLAVCLAVYLVFFCFLERRAGAGFNFKARHLTPALSPNEAEREETRHLIRPADTFSPVEAEKGTTPHPGPLPEPCRSRREEASSDNCGGKLAPPYVGSYSSDYWLLTFVVICLAGYAWHYPAAVKSLQVLVLLAGIVFGKGMAAWVNFRHRIRPADTFSPVEAEKVGARKANGIIFILLALLAGAALYQPETGPTFFYHGIQRWSGVWENPNLYGLLMGVGLVLGIGSGVLVIGNRVWRLGSGGKWFCAVLCFVAASVCGIGLFKSYSRGAWLGTAVGMGFLFWNSEVRIQKSEFAKWFHRNRWSFGVILASLAVLAFWQLRFSEFLPAQRLASVGNPNDFSWRNRVTAWQGAARMLLDRPLAGFGWGEAESSYAKNYCPATESAAIEMNDFLMLGISAGVPAMICLVVYVGLGMRRKPEMTQSLLTSAPTSQSEPSSIFYPPSAALPAAAVLLVGFWFDGGLFKLPVAAVFWMLLELGRNSSITAGQSCGPASITAETLAGLPRRRGSGALPGRPLTRGEIGLRGLAGLVALAAAGLTAVHLVTPRLAVSERTLGLARKFLVHPNERNHFEILAAQPIWRGEKLKTLLDHAELATYNRALVNWPVEDKMFQDFVLSPVIEPSTLNPPPSTDLNWRRKHWEAFYPRIRHESSPEDAAKIIVKQLRERGGAGSEWASQCAAALRAVGIPARLDANHQAEFFDDGKWQTLPAVTTTVQ